ncbi:phosphoribosyltransferase [Conyzicola sp.]|uniref:phosphoribosyltransferase n=1 Tax=Conyzicola sp. TaxID=1969404 RepID=UPI003988B7B0
MVAIFENRVDAGRRLGEAVRALLGEVDAADGAVVLGLPRGGVPVARQVADVVGAPLDVLAVRKLGGPRHPEFAIGAIGEGGVRLVDDDAVRHMRLGGGELERVEAAARIELARLLARYRGGRPALDLAGRRAIIVDDGVATGASATVACRAARLLGAGEVVLAVPIAPYGWEQKLAGEADAFVALATPRDFWAVGRWYVDFDQTTADEVISALDR